MASVDVKLTMSPAEFDLMRESVSEQYGFYLAKSQQSHQESGLSPSERRDHAARAAKLKDLHDRLNA